MALLSRDAGDAGYEFSVCTKDHNPYASRHAKGRRIASRPLHLLSLAAIAFTKYLQRVLHRDDGFVFARKAPPYTGP